MVPFGKERVWNGGACDDRYVVSKHEMLCLVICNTMDYFISMRLQGRLVIALNVIFQQNM